MVPSARACMIAAPGDERQVRANISGATDRCTAASAGRRLSLGSMVLDSAVLAALDKASEHVPAIKQFSHARCPLAREDAADEETDRFAHRDEAFDLERRFATAERCRGSARVDRRSVLQGLGEAPTPTPASHDQQPNGLGRTSYSS